jgi:hypothetical protein
MEVTPHTLERLQKGKRKFVTKGGDTKRRPVTDHLTEAFACYFQGTQ